MNTTTRANPPPAPPNAANGWAACAGMAITLSVLLASTTGWLGFLVVHHSGTSGLLGSEDWSGGQSVGASTGVY